MGCTSSDIMSIPDVINYMEEDSEQAEESTRLHFQDFQLFIDAIKKQIKSNQQIYDQYLPTTEIQVLLDQFKKRFVDHQSSKQIIGLIIDYLRYCKNENGCQPMLQTSFSAFFWKQFASRWQKVRDTIYFSNKSHLRLLSFIVDSKQGGYSYYDGCFQQYQMDLSEQSSKQLAAKVLLMSRQHIGSFAFLTSFLWGSCVKLNSLGASIQEIRQKYSAVLQSLCKIYRPAPQIGGKNRLLDKHESFKNLQLIPKIEINLLQFQDKHTALDDFIMKRADDAFAKYEIFNKLMLSVCYKNDGYHFKSGLKIRKRSQAKALLRIKQKILNDLYATVQIEEITPSQKKSSSDTLTISQLVKKQKKAYEQKINKIFEQLKTPIVFKVSDMLRGKCMFATVDKINKCCSDILKAQKRKQFKGFRVIQIDNRLRKGTSDLVLKVLLGNVIAEMQLVINLDISEYSFAHKLYQLQRSKFFTPLTQLSILNQDVTRSYLLQAKAVVKGNAGNQQFDYKQTVNFKLVSPYFDSFIKKLQVQFNDNDKFSEQVDLSSMGLEIKKFEKLIDSSCKQKKAVDESYQTNINYGFYLAEINQFDNALSRLQIGLKELTQKTNPSDRNTQRFIMKKKEVLLKIGDIYKELGNDLKAIQYYSQSEKNISQFYGKESIQIAEAKLKIGEAENRLGNYEKSLELMQFCLQNTEKSRGKISAEAGEILLDLGSIHFKKEKFSKALKYYQRAFEVLQQVKGRQSIEVAKIFNNIGNVYYQEKNFSKALQFYSQCLQIQQRLQGKYSIYVAQTYNNMSNVYTQQLQYAKAIQLLQNCLQIQQRLKGRQNFGTVLTLNNMAAIYSSQHNFKKALQYYEKSLIISQRVKGRDSIDAALILNYLGATYQKQGNSIRSTRCFQQSVKIYEKVGVKDQQKMRKQLGNSSGRYKKK